MSNYQEPLLRTAGLYHGGDLHWAEKRFGHPAQGWVDLSTGVNPCPYPFTQPNPACWQRLPDTRLTGSLVEAAVAVYGAPGPGLVVPVPGSQAAIQWLPRLRSRSRVRVLGPTYSEHAAAWAAAGHRVESITDPASLPGTADVVVIVNPNNPDGRVVSLDTLEEIRSALADRGGWLVVDEAFADVEPPASVAHLTDRPGLVVLRSAGKFYGLPGLRLGFVLTNPSIAFALRAAVGPWAVSGAACAIGAEALKDTDWHAETRRALDSAARRLDGLLADAGLAVCGGTALFRLAEHGDALSFFETLAQHGIFVRHFPEYPRWLRFGLPGEETQWARLTEALGAG